MGVAPSFISWWSGMFAEDKVQAVPATFGEAFKLARVHAAVPDVGKLSVETVDLAAIVSPLGLQF